MAVFADNQDFAALVMPDVAGRRWRPALAGGDVDRCVGTLLEEPVRMAPVGAGPWRHILLAGHARASNYDRLIELARAAPLPDRLVCVAGSGDGFHGFKGRSWSAVPGNLHLSVHLAPHRPVERFEVAFMALAAVSVVDAIDRVAGLEGRAGIRWVNDVVMDGAKVAGVLAYTQAQQDTVNAAILGIGVNVDTRPPVEPTPFVPTVTHLADHVAAPALLPAFFGHLLNALDRNYRLLLARGTRRLVDRYRDRSVVVGHNVTVCADEPAPRPRVLRRGVVRSVGDGLELYLEGQDAPVTRGRIVLGGPNPAAAAVERRAV